MPDTHDVVGELVKALRPIEVELAQAWWEASTHASDAVNRRKAELELARVGPSDIQVRTFRSRIDGSVQPYAARPALKRDLAAADKLTQGNEGAGVAALPGVIVTLHDAATSCEDQVALYTPKTWAHVVAPTGRRPRGAP